jgi:hypothetical protein
MSTYLNGVSAGASVASNTTKPNPNIFLGSTVLMYGGAPTANNAVYVPASVGSYMLLGTEVPSNFSLAIANCFIETWVYFNSITALGTAYQNIVARQYQGLSQFQLGVSTSLVAFGAKQAVGGTGVVSANTFSLSTGRWYHIAGSWNLQTLTLNVFINGFGGNATTMTTPGFLPYIPVTIGGSYFINGQNDYYIQDVRMTKGGNVPTGNFTPIQGPFPKATPTYVAGMGPVVLSLNSEYISPVITMR